MKSVLYTLLFTLWGLAAAAQVTFYDANATLRSTEPFENITVSGSFDVYINQHDSTMLAVSAAQAENIADIKTEVKNGTLHISYQPKQSAWSGNRKLKAYISVPFLENITVSGAATIHFKESFKAVNLSISLSGASDCTGDVVAQKLSLSASGASDFSMSGQVRNVVVNISGASDVKGYDLHAQTLDVTASGASDVRMTVQQEIKANISGASDLNYKGNATVVDVKKSGSSNVKKAD